MKNFKKYITKLLLLMTFMTILNSCNGETQELPCCINGQWSLIKYEPGISPTQNFNTGEISWTFQSTNNIQVQVGSSVNSPPLQTTGKYNFSINGNRILIDDVEYDFSINEHTLIISEGYFV